MTDEERPDYYPPKGPFYIDGDGDICDANGWLVVCPAKDVWATDLGLAGRVCDQLNKEFGNDT